MNLPVRICPNCGLNLDAANAQGLEHCPKCGHQIPTVETESSDPPPRNARADLVMFLKLALMVAPAGLFILFQNLSGDPASRVGEADHTRIVFAFLAYLALPVFISFYLGFSLASGLDGFARLVTGVVVGSLILLLNVTLVFFKYGCAPMFK